MPVQGEWHDFFRAARDVLADAAARLMDGQSPAGSPALQRMIALRDALQAGEDAEVTVQVPPPPAIGQAASDVGDFFRSEARLLLERVQKLARELDGAAHDRQAAIRRELDATLSALRDTAGTFGYPNPASLAEDARLRARRGTGAELLGLLPGLSDAVEATAGGASSAAPPPEAGQEDAVPVEELLYRGEAAIRRAHELRPTLERAIAGDPAARDALEELYDLLDRIRS